MKRGAFLSFDVPVDVVEDLVIEESNLVEELKTQPVKYYRYAKAALELFRQMSLKEIELKEKEAEIAKEFRNEKKEKITENMVKEYLAAHPTLVELRRELVELEYQYRMLDTARHAFLQRATMLELLVRINSA